MKALVWKELRENILWAVLAMLALGAAEIYAIHQGVNPGQMDLGYNDGITLCRKQFLIVTLFGCAVVGLGLGLLQVLPELKRDRWAALLHRPVSPGQFFWGKALAGVLLYFLAAGVPFLFVVWQVATPGHFTTPFLPEMIRPGLADLMAGLCYYFAALLVALQVGGLFLRLLPLFAALHVSFFAVQENLFGVVVESIVAMLLPLCLAGWGAIHARESLRRRPWLGRVAFLVIAFYGVSGVGDLLKTLGAMAGRMGEEKFSAWEFCENGAPARLDYVNDVLVAATDVEGKPFADPNYHPDRIRSHTLGLNNATSYVGDSHGWHPAHYDRSYRESYSYLYRFQPYSHPRPEQWFLVYGGKRLVGMLPMERRPFAQLDEDGFAPSGSSVRPFPEDARTSEVDGNFIVIAEPGSLRRADLPKRKVVAIDLPAPGPIYGMGSTWARLGNESIDFQGVALGTGMAVFDRNTKVMAMLPYHYDVDRWGRLSLAILNSMDRFVIRYEPSFWIDGKTRKSMPSYAEIVDAQGQAITSYTLPPLPPNVSGATWSTFVAEHLESPAFFFGEMLYYRSGTPLSSKRFREALRKQWGGATWASTWQEGQVLSLVALLLSVATFFWARRAQVPPWRAGWWTAGVLLLGLPGFVMFWLIGERPRTVPCPTCRRPRRIAAEQCAHCGAAWPDRSADATEIFDRTPTPSLAASA